MAGNCFFNCGCGTDHPPPACLGLRACVRVVGLGGSPVAELVATITFTNPAVGGGPDIVVSGHPDGDGNFCADPPSRPGPPVVYGTPRWASIASPLGATIYAPFAYNPATGTCDARFDYCKKIVVGYAYDGDGADPGHGGGIAASIWVGDVFEGGAQVPDDYTQAPSVGFVSDGSTGTWTFEEVISLDVGGLGLAAASAGIVPSSVAATAEGYYGDYRCCCGYLGGPACVACGETQYVGVPLFLAEKYAWNPDCTAVRCPTGPARKAVTPKRLFATFTGPAPVFGGDSGVSVELDWDPGTWDGRDDHPFAGPPNNPRAIVWESSCEPSGSYGGCYTQSTHNCLTEVGVRYADYVLLGTVPYGSRRIVLGRVPAEFPHPGIAPAISYNNFWNSSCNPTDPAPVCSGSGDTAIRATPFGYCDYAGGCPPYTTLPAPSGPTQFYPKSVAVSLGPSILGLPLWPCAEVTDLEVTAPFGTACAIPGGTPTVTVVVTE